LEVTVHFVEDGKLNSDKEDGDENEDEYDPNEFKFLGN
jgi:hypothetical protein